MLPACIRVFTVSTGRVTRVAHRPAAAPDLKKDKSEAPVQQRSPSTRIAAQKAKLIKKDAEKVYVFEDILENLSMKAGKAIQKSSRARKAAELTPKEAWLEILGNHQVLKSSSFKEEIADALGGSDPPTAPSCLHLLLDPVKTVTDILSSVIEKPLLVNYVAGICTKILDRGEKHISALSVLIY